MKVTKMVTCTSIHMYEPRKPLAPIAPKSGSPARLCVKSQRLGLEHKPVYPASTICWPVCHAPRGFSSLNLSNFQEDTKIATGCFQTSAYAGKLPR
jgi:hypothetical protein